MNLKQEIVRTHAAVARGEPGAKNKLERLQAEYRSTGLIERVGGTATLIEGRRPIARAKAAPAKDLPFGFDYRDVELVERGYAVDFSVTLGSTARETILGEIQRTHREAGDVEVAGWLFAQSQLRHDTLFLTVAFASVAARGDATTVSLGDPIDGIALARSEGLADCWRLCGDWHSHEIRGSDLPSFQDAKAWAGTADWLARSCYVSLVVSPAESGGWTYPSITAWVARRFGAPSRPVVQRARLEW